MASFNEIIFDVMELARGNQISDDTELDERHVTYLLNNQRSLWLRNEYNKPGRSIDSNIIQDLGCLELEEASPEDCCIETNGCIVLRTKKKIPNTIELHAKTAITRVGPINKTSSPFSFMPYHKAVYSGNGRYNKNIVFTYILNNRIYIKTNSLAANMLDYINVRGVFEDPTAAAEFIDCDGKPCFTYEDEYPINNWMIPFVKEQVLNQLGVALSTPKDESNDAKEDINKQ